MIPRFIHRIYAFLLGYFWLPCPLCGKPFGGHEWTNSDSVLVEGHNSGICNACARTRALPCGCPPGQTVFGMQIHRPECFDGRGGFYQQSE